MPLYREHLFHVEPDGCPLGCRFYGRKMDYSQVSCPVAEHACANEALWIFQSVLLGTKDDMNDIASAVSKVRENVDELL